MNERPIGVLARTFARREEDIPYRIEMLEKMVKTFDSITICGQPFVRRIDLLVWADLDNYPNEADCGKLAPALREHFEDYKNVYIQEVKSGGLCCGTLNYGTHIQTRKGCDYSLIVSPEVTSSLSQEIAEQMVEAAANGARATGVAFAEVAKVVLEGRLQNTFTLWHLQSLHAVGGFDVSVERMAKTDPQTRYLKGWSETERKTMYYPTGGVEEMLPLARLVDMFQKRHGPCIAPIKPKKLEGYEMPDPEKDPELYNRHAAKWATKIARQLAVLMNNGYHTEHIKGGVMPNQIKS